MRTNVQGKDGKAVATQGKVTAQNPSNQSKEKFFGIFTDEDVQSFSKYFEGDGLVQPSFFVNTIHMAHRALKGGRMPEDNKAAIRMAFALFGSLVSGLGNAYEKLTNEK